MAEVYLSKSYFVHTRSTHSISDEQTNIPYLTQVHNTNKNSCAYLGSFSYTLPMLPEGACTGTWSSKTLSTISVWSVQMTGILQQVQSDTLGDRSSQTHWETGAVRHIGRQEQSDTLGDRSSQTHWETAKRQPDTTRGNYSRSTALNLSAQDSAQKRRMRRG